MICLLEFVRLIHGSGLRSNHAYAAQGSKTQMRQIAVLNFPKTLRIWICKVEIAPQHCHVYVIFLKHSL